MPDPEREKKFKEDSPFLYKKNQIQRILMDAALRKANATAAVKNQPARSLMEVWFGTNGPSAPGNLSSGFNALYEEGPEEFRQALASPDKVAELLERIEDYQAQTPPKTRH